MRFRNTLIRPRCHITIGGDMHIYWKSNIHTTIKEYMGKCTVFHYLNKDTFYIATAAIRNIPRVLTS